MNNPLELTVISFVGPSGGGKTTLINNLTSKFHVLKSNYIELNIHNIDNTLILSKWTYIQYWFDKILKAKENNIDAILTDRCPFDTCAYIPTGNSELLQLLTTSFAELMQFNIAIKKVLITARFEILQHRIKERLIHDTIRLNYHESDIMHNRHAYKFYKDNLHLWDYVIDTSELSITEMIKVSEGVIDNIKLG